MKIYTVFYVYFATGEGTTFSVSIAYTQETAIDMFIRTFGQYYFSGARVIENEKIPDDVRMWVPQHVIDMFESKLGPTAFQTWCGQFHVNYS